MGYKLERHMLGRHNLEWDTSCEYIGQKDISQKGIQARMTQARKTQARKTQARNT